MQDPKNCQKLAIWAPSHNFVRLYLRNQGRYRQSEKKLLNSSTSPTCPHNMVNFGPLTAEIHSGVWGIPANFNGFSRLGFVTAATSLTGGQPNFARCLAVSWAGTLYIQLRGLLPLTEFCPVQNSLYVQVLRSPILAALLHGIPALGISQTLRCGKGMELRNFRRGRHLYSAGRPYLLQHWCTLPWFSITVDYTAE